MTMRSPWRGEGETAVGPLLEVIHEGGLGAPSGRAVLAKAAAALGGTPSL